MVVRSALDCRMSPFPQASSLARQKKSWRSAASSKTCESDLDRRRARRSTRNTSRWKESSLLYTPRSRRWRTTSRLSARTFLPSVSSCSGSSHRESERHLRMIEI